MLVQYWIIVVILIGAVILILITDKLNVSTFQKEYLHICFFGLTIAAKRKQARATTSTLSFFNVSIDTITILQC